MSKKDQPYPPKQNNQKIKLLKLYQLLKEETDEQHPLTTKEICGKIADMSITCDRRTLSKDMDMLNQYGYEIMSVRKNREKAYYIEDRSFSIPELKILIDAVHAATFITKMKSDELINKIASLSSNNRAEILKGNRVCFNTRKHSNESIYYNVNFLNEAMLHCKKASFYYYDLSEHGQKQYRKNKDRYIVEPIALVYKEDNYYLMCFSSKYSNIASYRLDRMEGVEVENEDVSKEAIIQMDNVSEHTDQVFKMYGGKSKNVSLQFDSSLIGSVYDKFGEDTKISSYNEDSFVTSVKVQISPVFFGWLFQFSDKIKLLSPKSVADEYKEQAKKLAKI